MVNVCIRVDGSMQVGMGHMVRCMALAQMIQNDFTVHFACRDIPETTKAELNENGFRLSVLKDDDEFLQLLTAKDIAVIDGYNFDLSYQQKIKVTDTSLICIDDMHSHPFVADGIINQAPGVTKDQYTAAPFTQFALGTQYALLRPAFLQAAKSKRVVTASDSVLICFGGGDFKNLTQSVLQTVVNAGTFKNITVITGPAYSFMDTLQPILSSQKNIQHHHAISETEMLNLMITADVAIVPASGILYEALCAGCKIISGTYVDNQQHIYNAFKQQGAFISARNFSPDEVVNALQQLNNFTPVNNNIIDGLSPKRITTFFYDIKLSVRNANADDCQLLFKWANDADVRSNAINKEPIQWEGHVKWFNSKLQSSNAKIFILEYNGEPAAQVRYDLDDDGEWVIDYSVDREFRGKGFGRSLIEKTLPHLAGASIKALVLKGNVASAATFEKLHFTPAGDTTIHGQTFLVYKYQ